MRKVLTGIALLAVVCLQLPASAAPWFDRWDTNHDGSWNWEEYRAAQMDWCRHHHIKCDEARLRAEWGNMAHDGRAYPNDAYGLHPW